jgi:uroporphyrinogen decarboxylase
MRKKEGHQLAGIKPGAPAKPVLRALAGETLDRSPWWMMRQAGRYLPEYRALRARAGDFITLCLTPELAAEATLQPIRRFGMDAAILFSDLPLVLWALGQGLTYGDTGPVLDAVTKASDLTRLDSAGVRSRLEPVGEAVRLVRANLPDRTALIGFAGAPWTVATYMVEGGTSRDFFRVKSWTYRDPTGFAALIEQVADATFEFLSLQIENGAEAVQLFDSWAGALSPAGFERWVIAPTRKLVVRLKDRFPHLPVIGFPRGAGLFYERYVAETGVDAVGLDTSVPMAFARERLQSRIAVQGNLDPVLLATGGNEMRRAAFELRAGLGGGPFIFNLGHGVLPETPPEQVAELARILKERLPAT